MNKILSIATFAGIIFLSSCGASTKQDDTDLAAEKGRTG